MKLTRTLLFFFIPFIVPCSLLGQEPSSAVKTGSLIFPLQSEHVHGSSIVSLANGDFLVAWFQGSGERKADDVRIMGSRLSKGEKKWSTPFILADTPHLPDCNPVLFLNGKGTLFLVWIAVQANRWENSILRFKTSSAYLAPGAPTWSWQDNILLKPDESFAEETEINFKKLPALHHGWSEYAPSYDKMIVEAAKDPSKRSIGWMTRIKPLILKSGRILLPLYSDGFNMSIMAISDDDGATWLPSLPVVGRGPIQPALARKSNGTIVAYMRDSGDAPNRVQKSESGDEGQSWTPAVRTTMPNTASVELLRLSDGRWVFLGNDLEDGRYHLSLYVSSNEGETWKLAKRIENEKEGSFSYPSMIQTLDGRLHITYSFHPAKNQKSIKYVTLDASKIHPIEN